MKTLVTTLSALLISSSFSFGEDWKFKKSPLDGIVELTQTVEKSGNSYRQFVNAAHIIEVTLKIPKNQDYASITFTTTEIKPTRVSIQATSDSVSRYLKFKTEEDAEVVLRQITAEMAFTHRLRPLPPRMPSPPKKAAE